MTQIIRHRFDFTNVGADHKVQKARSFHRIETFCRISTNDLAFRYFFADFQRRQVAQRSVGHVKELRGPRHRQRKGGNETNFRIFHRPVLHDRWRDLRAEGLQGLHATHHRRRQLQAGANSMKKTIVKMIYSVKSWRVLKNLRFLYTQDGLLFTKNGFTDVYNIDVLCQCNKTFAKKLCL